MIILKNVHKSFNDKEVLKGLNITIPPKTIGVLLGPNGTGKSTTLKIIANLLSIDKGEVVLNKKKIGYLPEIPYLYPELTGEEMLYFIKEINNLSSEEFEERKNFLAKFFNLEEYMNSLCKTFSQGTRQKFALIMNLLTDPEVLILDEPLTGLDPIFRIKVKRLLKELKSRDKIIIIATHDINFAVDIADILFILHNGKVFCSGTPDEILRMHKVSNIELLFERLYQA